MTAPIGRATLIEGVLAATEKLVNHVGNGDWQSAHKTVADRRLLLEQLARQEPQPGEHDFLRALRDAASESEAALRAMNSAAPQR
ncbi:MAG TPA: hypothetical protein VET48_04215 [Steroidobacteraceae bacterium]|nr:hypothetical protein [Steroidobacteraceae bacterium]